MMMLEDKTQLEEILNQIKDLVYEAEDILRSEPNVHAQAKQYWIAHILMALDKEHDYLGGSMITMQDSINKIAVESEMDSDGYIESTCVLCNHQTRVQDGVCDPCYEKHA